MLVSSLLLLSPQTALSLATLLWTTQCVHAALIIVEPQSVLHVTSMAELRGEKPLREEECGVLKHTVVSSASLHLSGMS